MNSENSNFERFKMNLNEKLVKIKTTSDYSHLAITANCEELPNSNEKIAYKSNSSLLLKNSIKANNLIREFVYETYDLCELTEHISVTIEFTKEDKTEKENKGNKKDKKFKAELPKFKLEDVILTTENRKEIEDALSMIMHFNVVYDLWGFREKEPSAKTNICFYGAPGTGKTMCAHGIAQSLNKKILIASYADIQSEYVGVGPKNLREVFKEAEENDAVLFFDEADSFLRKRTSDTNSSAAMHYNSMTNEMMKHLEDFNGVVIFATNLTENTDEAFKTRLATSVEFKKPDLETRAKIIEYMIPSKLPLVKPFSEEDYKTIANECDDFVGRDIRNAIKRILSKGAHSGKTSFELQDFIIGFQEYKITKEKFESSITGKKKKGVNPLDIYSANGSILMLLTYIIWYDGKETEEDAAVLKKYAKILSRNKPVINKLSDLPDMNEICDEIKDSSLKQKALEYVCEVLAQVDYNTDLCSEIIKKVSSLLNISEKEEFAFKYYTHLFEANQLRKELN